MSQNSVQLRTPYEVFLGERYSRSKVARLVTFGCFKRGFDLIASSAFLVLLSPLFAVVAVAIKLDSPGPILFRQERTGKHGKAFKMYKFRSMAADNDIKDATCGDKYTRVGKFIRRTSMTNYHSLST